MNTTLEQQDRCQATLHVEMPAEKVTAEREAITKAFIHQAKIPGFRPGKAPISLIQNRFKDDITEELQSRLLNQGFSEGVEKEQLKVISITGVRDQSLNPDDSFTFTAELLLAPEFELPEYKGITVQVPVSEVTDDDVDQSLEQLRERFADFEDVEGRGLAMEDFAVIDFEGTLDGAPLADALPDQAKHLASSAGFWIRMADDSFLPGFCEKVVGMAVDENRTVEVDLPADFPVTEIAGKAVSYAVTLKEIKKQKLPELDDEFAGKLEEGKTLEEIRGAVREQIVAERANQSEEIKTNQIIAFLDEKIDFDLPDSMVNSETQRQVNDIVQRSQRSGMDQGQIEEHSEEIINSASHQAKMNVKTTFILEEIAAAEKIEPSEQDLIQRVSMMAAQAGTPLQKYLKELQKSDSLGRIRNSLRISKTLDFLRSNASVEEVDPPKEPEA